METSNDSGVARHAHVLYAEVYSLFVQQISRIIGRRFRRW